MKNAKGETVSMHGTTKEKGPDGKLIKDPSRSALSFLKACPDFRDEKTQLETIINTLGGLFQLTPKCHPEIAGRGIEYAWGYSKFKFRKEINDGVSSHLKENVLKALSRSLLTVERMRKFARKAREYKLTYSFLAERIAQQDQDGNRQSKESIDHITKTFKQHRSALDADFSFIVTA
jgi:hypothetical protein